MTPALPLESMSTADKIRAMEALWDSLCRNPEEVPSPAWHGELLHEREERAQKGESRFINWDEAKRKIREDIRGSFGFSTRPYVI